MTSVSNFFVTVFFWTTIILLTLWTVDLWVKIVTGRKKNVAYVEFHGP